MEADLLILDESFAALDPQTLQANLAFVLEAAPHQAAVPVVAVLLAVSVKTLVEEVGFVPNVAVTPLGRPDAARAETNADAPGIGTTRM